MTACLDPSCPAPDGTRACDDDEFPDRPCAALCIECGDHRGWRVEPDWNTGEAVQVQCRACAEHECPPPPAEEPSS